MTEQWRGAFKVVEECGELLQVLGKLGPFPSGKHPDGGLSLRLRLHDEIADLEAALAYFKSENDFDEAYVAKRRSAKLVKFCKWRLTGFAETEEKAYGRLEGCLPERTTGYEDDHGSTHLLGCECNFCHGRRMLDVACARCKVCGQCGRALTDGICPDCL